MNLNYLNRKSFFTKSLEQVFKKQSIVKKQLLSLRQNTSYICGFNLSFFTIYLINSNNSNCRTIYYKLWPQQKDDINIRVAKQLPQWQLGYGPINHIYMSRFLQRAGDCEERFSKDRNDALMNAQWKLQRSLENLAKNNKKFSGRLIGVGSYFEGVPFSGDELDFVYELDCNILGKQSEIIQQTKVNTFKPREKSDIFPATYFKIKCGHKFLKPSPLQEQFKKLLIKYFVKSIDPDPNPSIIISKGPAVVLFLEYFNAESSSKQRLGDIKLDITLSIPIKTGKNLLSAWFAGQSTPINVPLYHLYQDSIRSAHLVPAGDFWKLSLSVKERDLVKEAMKDAGKRTCYAAIKVIYIMTLSVSLDLMAKIDVALHL